MQALLANPIAGSRMYTHSSHPPCCSRLRLVAAGCDEPDVGGCFDSESQGGGTGSCTSKQTSSCHALPPARRLPHCEHDATLQAKLSSHPVPGLRRSIARSISCSSTLVGATVLALMFCCNWLLPQRCYWQQGLIAHLVANWHHRPSVCLPAQAQARPHALLQGEASVRRFSHLGLPTAASSLPAACWSSCK